jgi:hypothetical protein
MNDVETFFTWWTFLAFIGFFMLNIRSDKLKIYKEIEYFLCRPFPLWIVSLIIIYATLPPSILFTLFSYMDEDDNKDDSERHN